MVVNSKSGLRFRTRKLGFIVKIHTLLVLNLEPSYTNLPYIPFCVCPFQVTLAALAALPSPNTTPTLAPPRLAPHPLAPPIFAPPTETTPLKPACAVCGRRFDMAWQVSRHMATHTGQKPYTCPHCPHSSARPDNLNRHIRMKHSHVLPSATPTDQRPTWVHSVDP